MTYRKSMSDAIREVQEATIKPYVSMSMSGQYNVLDKDGKVAYSTRDKTLAYDYFKKNYDKLKEDGDHEVSMAIGQLKTISQYAEKMQTILQSKGNDYDIEAWVQSKITSAEDYMNSVAHYMENDPSVNEEVNEVSDKLKLAVLKKKIKQYKDKVFKKTMSTIKSPLFAGDEIEEGRMKDIFTADQEGKSAEEIAKLMKLPLKTVKSILGEEVYQDIAEFTSDMIKRLQKSYSTMPKTISPEQAKALSKHLDRLDLSSLKQLTKANIPFVTTLARNKVYKKTGKFEAVEEVSYDPTMFSPDKVAKAMAIAVKSDGQYSKAVRDIEMIAKNLSKVSTIARELKKQNEQLEEQSSSEIMNKAKEFGVTAKMTSQGIDISGFKTQAGMDKFMKYIASQGKNMINLAKMGMKRNFEAVEEPMPKEEPKKDNEKKESENKDNTIASLKDQIAMLKTKLENEKNKAIKPEPNPETGEVPLTVGIAYKHFKDKKEKEEVKKEDVSEKAMTDREKRIQRAKDMIKYYDAQKKAALKGKNKDLAKKMLKNDIEESVGQVQTRPDGKGNFNLIFRGKEIGYYHREGGKYVVYYDKDGDDYDQSDEVSTTSQAKKLAYDNMNEAISVKAFKNAVDPSKKGLEISKTGGMSGMIVIKDKKELKDLETKLAQAKKLYNIKEMAKDDAYAIGMAQAKKSMNDEPPLEKKTIKKGHEIAKKILNKENTSAFNPTVHNKTLGVTSKDLDRAFSKLSQKAQSHVNDLLRTGMGTRDAIKKAKQKFNENNINEDRRLYVETIAGLKKKAEKSGMPYSILKKVYDRGMAAWKSGHRPGASQQQWAFARVNSFVTKSSGTWGGADKDLAKQVKG